MMKLPPFKLITHENSWQQCLKHLSRESRIAIDLEANSMFAYREQVCLIQISSPTQDFIIDPIQKINLSPLGLLIADPGVEKIFHAAEYDLILLKRQFGWELNNLFDTMWAARILGYSRFGLASLLGDFFQIKLDKKYQKSNWCQRPLKPEQLTYAQHDTHFLFKLRDKLAKEIKSTGREIEAAEIFAAQTKVKISNNEFSPDGFWSINGVNDLSRRQQAILKEINIYRDKEARERNQPLFKIFSDRTMLEIAKYTPGNMKELAQIHGMSPGQVRRYGRNLLRVIDEGNRAPYPQHPKRRHKRRSQVVTTRYEKLRQWRKKRAKIRGVESDVIVSKSALQEIALTNPKNLDELNNLDSMGPWHCRTYGQEILEVLETCSR